MRKENKIYCITEYDVKRDFGWVVYTNDFALTITIQCKKGYSGIGCGYGPAEMDVEGAVLKSWRTCKKVEKQGRRTSWHLILETNRGEADFYAYDEGSSGLDYRVRITMEAVI